MHFLHAKWSADCGAPTIHLSSRKEILMRCSTIVACASLLWGSTTFSAPTTQPSEAATAAPATQPAPVEAGRVLILHFAESTGDHFPWLAQAIQQDLLAALGRATRAKVDAPASAAPAQD